MTISCKLMQTGVVSEEREVESKQRGVDGGFTLRIDVIDETLRSMIYTVFSFAAMCLTLVFSLGGGLSSFPDMLDILLNPFGILFVALVVVYVFMLIRNHRFFSSLFDKKGQFCDGSKQFTAYANSLRTLGWVSVGLVLSLFLCFIWLFVHQGDDLTQAIKVSREGLLSLGVSVILLLMACKGSLKGFYLGLKV